MKTSSTPYIDPHTNQALRKKAALISLLIGVLMLVMKMGGYLITNSAAVLSDALESVVHVIATAITFYSILLIGRPADREHPYGYGKAEYFSAGMEGGLIVVAAIAIIYEATRDIIRGSTLKSLDIGVMVVAAAGAINLVLGFYLIRTGKKTRSLAVVADGKHVLTDSYTSIGVLVGLLLVKFTGWLLLDPIFAIGVALNIIATGYRLVRQAVRGLMNISDPETLERVVAVVNRIRTPQMLDMHRLRAWSSGEKQYIDFHLALPEKFLLAEVHEIQDMIRDALREEFDDQVDVMIHFDPCSDGYCVICGQQVCRNEEHRQQAAAPFTVTGAQGSPMHHHGEPVETTATEDEETIDA
jgi:cation diffusion facilitator family transporter